MHIFQIFTEFNPQSDTSNKKSGNFAAENRYSYVTILLKSI